MPERLKHLLSLRYRISTQMYSGIAGAMALTIAASFVGWISFNRVDEAQNRVVEGSLPEMAAAFRIAEYSRTLSAAAPRLVAATTVEELAQVSAEIAMAKEGFEDQLVLLRSLGEADDLLKTYIPNAQAVLFKLLFNIDEVESKMPELFDLTARAEGLRTELIDLKDRLDSIVVPAIDDQLFYQLTGYRELGTPPVPREVHFSEVEFDRYRHLAALLSDAILATQLLSSALSVADVVFIEPLQESFESAAGRLTISMSALGSSEFFAEIDPISTSLFEMGSEAGDGFDLLERKLNLEKEQRDQLTQTQDLALALVAEVDGLVTVAEEVADSANLASTQAILTGRTLLLVISAIGIFGALLISWGFVGRVLLRRIGRLSERMLHMADGDLEGEVNIEGRDEVADMAAALEVFRRHALEVQRLNLVEKLAAELGEKNSQLEHVLAELHRAQDQIVMQEKLAALGEVTAGVAHEIRNPLNFIKNFAEVSQELLEELNETLEGDNQSTEDQTELIEEITQDLTDNLERIGNHSSRANRIVQDMLMIGRGGGEWRLTDINTLLDEHARLAYHSARATDPDFQLDLQRDLDPDLGEVEVIPQDLGRTFLNMVGNSCQATDEKRLALLESRQDNEPYMPIVRLKTRRGPETAVISIYDNGAGIPPDVIEKIFNPFFTTKPTDKGTGLGLALSSDIIREHGGTIRIESVPGEFTEMIIEIPLVRSAIPVVEATEELGASGG